MPRGKDADAPKKPPISREKRYFSLRTPAGMPAVRAAAVTVMSAARMPSVRTAAVISVPMMRTVRPRNVSERAAEKGVYAFVRIALHTRINFDTCLRERRDRSAADPAAEQNFRAALFQKSRKRAVSRTVGRDHFACNDFAVFDFIKFEIFGMSEMLIHFPVFVCYGDLHIPHLQIVIADIVCA